MFRAELNCWCFSVKESRRRKMDVVSAAEVQEEEELEDELREAECALKGYPKAVPHPDEVEAIAGLGRAAAAPPARTLICAFAECVLYGDAAAVGGETEARGE
jgi:hypothetical protein